MFFQARDAGLFLGASRLPAHCTAASAFAPVRNARGRANNEWIRFTTPKRFIQQRTPADRMTDLSRQHPGAGAK
ncbi:hypothetical protein [Xenophilus azovorans]|jgi:hypothetical protein|uniref:hypothetical protein n=1 Tax=Xenophilus TaxID=151754 RepID=UPI0012ECFF61|nr:hypothetical protein [Xenophilus azovorans]